MQRFPTIFLVKVKLHIILKDLLIRINTMCCNILLVCLQLGLFDLISITERFFLWFIMFGVIVNSCYYKPWHTSQEGAIYWDISFWMILFHSSEKSNILPIIQSLHDMEFNPIILLLLKAISVVANNRSEVLIWTKWFPNTLWSPELNQMIR